MSYLQNHRVISSTDLDEVRDVVAKTIAPHSFDITGRHERFHANVATATYGEICLTHVAFGDVEMKVTSPEDDSGVLALYLPTSGAGVLHHAGQEVDFLPQRGFVRDMAEPLSARQDDFGALEVPLPKDQLKAHARALIGDAVDLTGISFDLEVDLTTPGGQVIRNTIHYIADLLGDHLNELDNPILQTQLKDMLFTQVLLQLPNSYRDALHHRAATTVVPYHVKRARDYIHAHADQNVGLGDIANAAKCSYRTLQRAFTNAYGVSPMTYLRTERLKRVRKQLLSDQGGGSVSNIAKSWGFTNMGRFAQAYAQEFGELPSETMRKRS